MSDRAYYWVCPKCGTDNEPGEACINCGNTAYSPGDMRPNFLLAEEAPKVLYLCDKRACDKCSPECNHTLDIRHAKNFELGADGKSFIETPGLQAIFKANTLLKPEVCEKIRNNLLKQAESGIIFVDGVLEPTIINGQIYEVSIVKRKAESE